MCGVSRGKSRKKIFIFIKAGAEGKKSTTVIFLCVFSSRLTPSQLLSSCCTNTRDRTAENINTDGFAAQSECGTRKVAKVGIELCACSRLKLNWWAGLAVYSCAIGFAGGLTASHLAMAFPQSKSTLPHRNGVVKQTAARIPAILHCSASSPIFVQWSPVRAEGNWLMGTARPTKSLGFSFGSRWLLLNRIKQQLNVMISIHKQCLVGCGVWRWN